MVYCPPVQHTKKKVWIATERFFICQLIVEEGKEVVKVYCRTSECSWFLQLITLLQDIVFSSEPTIKQPGRSVPLLLPAHCSRLFFLYSSSLISTSVLLKGACSQNQLWARLLCIFQPPLSFGILCSFACLPSCFPLSWEADGHN
jgi:hypothetical protein